MIKEIFHTIFSQFILFLKHQNKKVKIDKNCLKFDLTPININNILFFNLKEDSYLTSNYLFLIKEQQLKNILKNFNNLNSIEKSNFSENFSALNKLIQNIFFYKRENSTIIEINLFEKFNVYGLGLKFYKFNRLHEVFDNYNTDNALHSHFTDNLYSTSNIFYLVNKEICFPFIIDFPGFIRYDFCKTDKNKIRIKLASHSFNLIISAYRNLMEGIKFIYNLQNIFYKPPFFAFGYTHSRWGIKSLNEVQQIIDKHLIEKIPISNVCIDIDYMDNFKNFTISKNFEGSYSFKDISKIYQEKNIFLIPIIDAGIKIEKNYLPYETIIKNECYMKNKNGNIFIGKVWPGNCIFIDFTNQKSSDLWKDFIKNWINYSNTRGCWLDMNEPSIFDQKEKTLSKDSKTSDDIYEIKVHNIHPYYQIKSTFEAFEELNIRPMLFSRSGYTFSGRYSGNWTGDNRPNLKHLKYGFYEILSLSLSGTMYTGTDIGGFWTKASDKLLIQWFNCALFHPLFRNHSSIFSKRKEVYILKEKTKEKIKKIINFRYSLIPTIYSLYMSSIFFKTPYILPLLYNENYNLKTNKKNSQKNLYKELYKKIQKFDKSKILKKFEKNLLYEDAILVGDTIGYDPFNTNIFDFIYEYDTKLFKKFIFDENEIYIKKGKGIILTKKLEPCKNIFETSPFEILGYPDQNGIFTTYLYLDDGYTSNSYNKFALYEIKAIFEKEFFKNFEINTIFEDLTDNELKLKEEIIKNLKIVRS
jgi:alpha-glucosidase